MIQNNNHKPRSWTVWIPIILGLVTALCLFIRLDQPIVSFDLWWHMLIGKQFLATKTLIFDHSIFTWAEASPHHTYNAWIAQIILFFIYENADLTGLIMFRYAIFFISFLLAIHYARNINVVKHPLTWVIIAVGMMLSWTTFLVKPEIFSVGFITITVWLYYYIRSKGDKAIYHTYMIPALLVVWVNSHGGFFVVSLFFSGVIIGELLNAKFSPTQCMSSRLRLHLFIALALCFPAILINPYGYELPLDIIKTVLTPALHPEPSVLAYKPTSAFNEAPYYLLDYLIISMFIFIFLIWQKIKNREIDWVVILTFISYCGLFVQMGRVTYFLSPVFIFASLNLLSYRKKSNAWPNTSIGTTLIVISCISIIGLMSWRTWDDTRCDVMSINSKLSNRNNRTSAPIDETAYIKKHLSGKRIGNTYTEGGHLLYELWPDKQVLIDTREFPFRKWIKSHFEFQRGINVEQFVTDYKADYWLISYGYIRPLIWFIKSSDWKIAYLGPIGAVFVPSSDADTTTEISPNISTITSFIRISIAISAALQLDDLTFARRILEAATKNLYPHCQRDITFIKELDGIIKGYEAFRIADYQTAINLLNRETKYIQAPGKAIAAMLNLANQHWNSGDFLKARKWLSTAFNKKPHIIDLYNVMLTDWHMRNMGNPINRTLNDGIYWKTHAEYIVSQEKEFTIEHNILLDTAKAMIAGSYDGTSGLLSRFTLKSANAE